MDYPQKQMDAQSTSHNHPIILQHPQHQQQQIMQTPSALPQNPSNANHGNAITNPAITGQSQQQQIPQNSHQFPNQRTQRQPMSLQQHYQSYALMLRRCQADVQRNPALLHNRDFAQHFVKLQKAMQQIQSQLQQVMC